MTEKQFTFNNDSLLKDGEFWLDGQIPTLCNAEEICHELNKLHEENKELKEELRVYRQVANCHNCRYHNYDWYDNRRWEKHIYKILEEYRAKYGVDEGCERGE